MTLDFQEFFQASNPSKTIDPCNRQDRNYYVDFSSVQGGKIIRELGRTITRLSPDEPTCQLFTGHIGCGKSTELLRLKCELEQQDFQVIYFRSSQDLNMTDVDISDILLAIARQVSKSLEEIKVKLRPERFASLMQDVAKLLSTKLFSSFQARINDSEEVATSSIDDAFLAEQIGLLTAKARENKAVRSLLRQYLEPRVNLLLDLINQELIEPAIEQLKQQGKQGLVVIIDNLDRVNNKEKPSGRTQPEYLFIDRGEQLNKLNCHVVYTIPLVLFFSTDLARLRSRFGVEPKVLPMVRVKERDGANCEEGIALLQHMVLGRAFPALEPEERLSKMSTVFDSRETLQRLCLVSGGHIRSLLVLLYSCLQRDDLPISRTSLEKVILQRRQERSLAIKASEWQLLRQIAQEKMIKGDESYQNLLRSLFIFEYCNSSECWFDINPLLVGAEELN